MATVADSFEGSGEHRSPGLPIELALQVIGLAAPLSITEPVGMTLDFRWLANRRTFGRLRLVCHAALAHFCAHPPEWLSFYLGRVILGISAAPERVAAALQLSPTLRYVRDCQLAVDLGRPQSSEGICDLFSGCANRPGLAVAIPGCHPPLQALRSFSMTFIEPMAFSRVPVPRTVPNLSTLNGLRHLSIHASFDSGEVDVGEGFSWPRGLTHLELEYITFRDVRDVGLWRCTELETLVLTDVCLSEAFFRRQRLPDKSLKTLSIDDRHLTNAALSAMDFHLATGIEVLRLSSGLSSLKPLQLGRLHQLRLLDIGHNEELRDLRGLDLQELPKLKALSICSLKLSDWRTELSALSKALESSSLIRLELTQYGRSHRPLTDNDIADFNLQNTKALKALDLSANHITDAGMMALGLRGNTTLQQVGLGDCWDVSQALRDSLVTTPWRKATRLFSRRKEIWKHDSY